MSIAFETFHTLDGEWAVRLSSGGQVWGVVRVETKALALELGREWVEYITAMQAYASSPAFREFSESLN